ncbi:LrgB family protein [Oceanobacillus bengalensis]|uniref:LrgB family protein n=1 Tax=Oceanobacillus bengalensis TaxID=1435466 RepID=A0A494YSH5_9BACI|nr:LrgB family protein [Oceanobacillus bengalensis]RKQ12885.1 LrgB family protein [Oceanobacillus bengalensis]
MINILIGIISIIGTLLIYVLSIRLHKKFNYPFTLPILVATIILVIVLLTFDISYNTYMLGGDWVSELLGPAVVALAYPLYKERFLLKKLIMPIVCGTIAGGFVGVSTGVLLTKWAGFDSEIIFTISSKSVTTPVSMAITESLGGITPLAAVFVMIAGISGSVLSTYLFKYTGLKHYLGKGIALGSASHAIGTATALESSELEGSISSIAMILSAMLISIIAPGLVSILL